MARLSGNGRVWALIGGSDRGSSPVLINAYLLSWYTPTAMTTEPLTTSPSHAATKYRRRRVIAGRVLFCSGLALVLLLVVYLRVVEPWIPSGETVAFDISVLAWAIPAGIATASILISLAAFLSNSRLLRRQEQRD